MARAISYFVFSSNGSYLRWDDDTKINFLIRQYEMSITGGGGIDRLYAGAGTKVDAGALFASANTDELYLSGNFSDYTQTISAGGVYTFTGVAGGSHANEVVSFSMNSNGDKLVFANGHITVKSSDYLPVGGSYSAISAGSLTITPQTDPAIGAQPGDKPAKVFVFDAGGVNIPQLPIVDESINVSGGGGADKFYVRKGTNADAIGLFASAGQDVLYLTGRFNDYTQTKSAGGVYTFTRNFTDVADASLTEVVNVSMNSSGDQLVFADGGVTLRLADYLTGGSYANITAQQLNRAITTPGLLAATPALSLASDTGRSASDGLTNNSTINVTGLVTGGTWQYQVDGSDWATGTGSSFIASTGAHSYSVRQTDLAGLTSNVTTSVTYTLDTTAPVAPSLQLAVDTGQPGVPATLSDGITNNPTVNVGGLESEASWMWNIAFNDSSLSAANLATATTWLTQQGILGWKSGSGSSFLVPNIQDLLLGDLSNGALAIGGSDPVSRNALGPYYQPGLPVSITIRQTDAAGNVGEVSGPVVLRYDKVAPVEPMFTNARDSNHIKILTSLETGAIWRYQILSNNPDGSTPTPDPHGWITGTGSTFDLYTIGNNTRWIELTSMDLAGNVSGIVAYNYTVTLPVMP